MKITRIYIFGVVVAGAALFLAGLWIGKRNSTVTVDQSALETHIRADINQIEGRLQARFDSIEVLSRRVDNVLSYLPKNDSLQVINHNKYITNVQNILSSDSAERSEEYNRRSAKFWQWFKDAGVRDSVHTGR